MGYLDSGTVFVGFWQTPEHTEDSSILTPGRDAPGESLLGGADVSC